VIPARIQQTDKVVLGRAEKAMINSQPPTPNIQLQSICWDSGSLGIRNWEFGVES
jgi:hypothetical protein